MKKTTEQIKNEIISYLTKTSHHTFMKNGSYFKVLREETDDSVVFKMLQDEKVSLIDINQYIKWYGDNAKNVIKHRLFLHYHPDYKVIAIKSTTDVRKTINELIEKI